MQLARPVEREKGNYSIELDLLPAYSEQEIRAILQNRVKQLGNRPAGEFFTGLLQKRVGQVLIKSVGVSFDSPSSCLDRAKLDRLCEWIKSWQFTVTGTTGFLHSQVTAGGLSTESFDANTLASKRHQGLFAAGEILDVDGDCGGFNLQWAWSSGLAAAEAVIRYLEGTVC